MKSGSKWLQQGSGFEIHRRRYQVGIADRRDDKFGKRATQMRRRSAQMETSGAAGSAASAMPKWIQRDMIPSLEGSDARANLDHLAGRLVTENRGQSRDHAIGAEFPFIDMEVGAADSA